ncbi:MAG: hypothetical protein U5L96_05670 [Owenweeksia sp.]|nr:hypothetical protein [Owenweeksia sp.]
MAFLFVPVVFVAGQYTIDYNFALMLILGSLWALLRKKYLWAGVLLGLATGFRIFSSLAFILPLSLMHWPLSRLSNWMKYWVASGLTALLLPFAATIYLWYFLSTIFTNLHSPPGPVILYELSLGIRGIPLLVALTIIFVRFRLLRKSATQPSLHFLNVKPLLWSVILIWFLQMLVFLRLPFKAEFFIPGRTLFINADRPLMVGEWDVKIVAIAALIIHFYAGF